MATQVYRRVDAGDTPLLPEGVAGVDPGGLRRADLRRARTGVEGTEPDLSELASWLAREALAALGFFDGVAGVLYERRLMTLSSRKPPFHKISKAASTDSEPPLPEIPGHDTISSFTVSATLLSLRASSRVMAGLFPTRASSKLVDSGSMSDKDFTQWKAEDLGTCPHAFFCGYFVPRHSFLGLGVLGVLGPQGVLGVPTVSCFFLQGVPAPGLKSTSIFFFPGLSLFQVYPCTGFADLKTFKVFES